ncbi:unnamed protein product [Plasmodium vivax]|uniref:(malaria parasite P. vivax) hypothetical protein n=1 Tax=Plasmodium vivax TaxID=5855 RepID=A0A8S4HK93_PLAVI|nr:unnamed protein product [Plasmodium vivax]
MSDINEQEQIPRLFYKRLDVHEDASNLSNLVSNTAFLSVVTHDKSKNILAQLARNIKLIASEYPENYVKRCRDINYWMDEKITTPQNSILASDLKSSCYFVFNDIKWPTVPGKRVCERKEKPYSSGDAKLMKELDDYCEIRNNVRCYKFENYEQILRYNAYIKEKREYFRSKMKVICQQNNCTWDDYKIDNKCTLNDLDITFRAIDCDDLYKEEFTPVGSILNRFRRRKYDLKRNIERVFDDRYSLYHSEPMPPDSENKRYYIEYARPHN